MSGREKTSKATTLSMSSSAPESTGSKKTSSNSSHESKTKQAIYEMRDAIMTVTNLNTGKFCSAFSINDGLIVCLNHILEQDLDSRLVLTLNNYAQMKESRVVQVKLLGVDLAQGLMVLVCPPDVKPRSLRWEDIYQYSEGNQVLCIGSSELGDGISVFTYISKVRAVDSNNVIPGEVMLLGQEVIPGSVVISKKGVLGLVVTNREGHAIALTEKSMRSVKAFIRLWQDSECTKYSQVTRKKESSPWIRHKYCVGVYGRPVRPGDHPDLKTLIGYIVTASDREEIKVGSIITHIDGVIIGDRMGQTIGSHILWSKTGPNVVKLTFLGGSEIEIVLVLYPESMDDYSAVKYCL